LSKLNIICLTPVKNEAWILERFLKCASLWADYIIIADQNSNDGSREIAKNFEKVILLDNPMQECDEDKRQKILLEAARKIAEPRLLIALDADEILTSNFSTSKEWQSVLKAKQGTIIRFDCVQLKPDMQHYWLVPDAPLGFMDDGSDHIGSDIHSVRIPLPDKSPSIKLREIKVMHYQFTDWQRMESKHRWYQCWERLKHPSRRPIKIYRQYHHMYAVSDDSISNILPEWINGYEKREIDMTSIVCENIYWWDKEVLNFLKTWDSSKFRKEAIWDIDWADLARKLNCNNHGYEFSDPRSRIDKYIHLWLKKTQPYSMKLHIRIIEKILSLWDW